MTLRVRALSEEEGHRLARMTRSQKLGAGLVRRAQIIQHAVDGLSAPGIAAKMAMLGVLDWATRELLVHTSRTKRSSDFIDLLSELGRRYGPRPGMISKPVVLVLDNGPIHTSKASRAALAARAHWLTVEWLPKYAPELNDIEDVWRDMKRHHLAHQTFASADDLDRGIHQAVTDLNRERMHHPLDNQRISA